MKDPQLGSIAVAKTYVIGKNKDRYGQYGRFDVKHYSKTKDDGSILDTPDPSEGDVITRVSGYFQCNKNRKWSFQAVACDEQIPNRPGIWRNVYGRKLNPRERIETVIDETSSKTHYPVRTCELVPQNPHISCNTEGRAAHVVLKPYTQKDSKGRFIRQVNQRLKKVIPEIQRYIPVGVPLKFVYGFDGKAPTIYEASCKSHSRRITVDKSSRYCAEDNPNNKLDLLFIIDNSGSMGDDQRQLRDNIPRFLDNLFRGLEVDYRIGAASSDTGRLNFRKWENLPKHDLKRELRAHILNMGTRGSAKEYFLKNIQTIKERYRFFRHNSYKAFFILTDEDEASCHGSAPSRREIINASQSMYSFIRAARDWWNDPKKLIWTLSYGNFCYRQHTLIPRFKGFLEGLGLPPERAGVINISAGSWGDAVSSFGNEINKLIRGRRPQLQMPSGVFDADKDIRYGQIGEGRDASIYSKIEINSCR